MYPEPVGIERAHRPKPYRPDFSARRLYVELLNETGDPAAVARSQGFLCEQLRAAATYECDLPDDLSALGGWLDASTAAVGEQYLAYREMRASGGTRRYFSNRSHALYFLKGVAPTRLVDGAWL